MDVHNSFICDSQKLETVQMFERIDASILWYIHTKNIYQVWKGWTPDKYHNKWVSKFQNNYTKLKEAKQKGTCFVILFI